jgi:hypothetical protein
LCGSRNTARSVAFSPACSGARRPPLLQPSSRSRPAPPRTSRSGDGAPRRVGVDRAPGPAPRENRPGPAERLPTRPPEGRLVDNTQRGDDGTADTAASSECHWCGNCSSVALPSLPTTTPGVSRIAKARVTGSHRNFARPRGNVKPDRVQFINPTVSSLYPRLVSKSDRVQFINPALSSL